MLNDLHPAKGSRHKPARLGLGKGSGSGKTAGRGHKGQNARTGGGVRPGFEGGQMPLSRRTPKRGFHTPFAREWQVVNITMLNVFPDNSEVTPEVLYQHGLIRRAGVSVKILGNGKLERNLKVKAHGFSASAKQAIEKLQGQTEVIR